MKTQEIKNKKNLYNNKIYFFNNNKFYKINAKSVA